MPSLSQVTKVGGDCKEVQPRVREEEDDVRRDGRRSCKAGAAAKIKWHCEGTQEQKSIGVGKFTSKTVYH